MNTSWSTDPALRERRKRDLLVASKLMRLHADDALREIGEPIDLWAGRVARVRQGLHELGVRPVVAAGAGLLAIVFAARWRLRRRRVDPADRASRSANHSARWARVWSLGWTAWRLWRRWQAIRPPVA